VDLERIARRDRKGHDHGERASGDDNDRDATDGAGYRASGRESGVKPGWRSSELWVTVALPMACQYVTSLSHIAGPWGMLAGAVAAGLYSLARGLAKS
jgi:hypothetical protein